MLDRPKKEVKKAPNLPEARGEPFFIARMSQNGQKVSQLQKKNRITTRPLRRAMLNRPKKKKSQLQKMAESPRAHSAEPCSTGPKKKKEQE